MTKYVKLSNFSYAHFPSLYHMWRAFIYFNFFITLVSENYLHIPIEVLIMYMLCKYFLPVSACLFIFLIMGFEEKF